MRVVYVSNIMPSGVFCIYLFEYIVRNKEFRKIFPSSKDANLIDKRIKKFVRITRKKTPFSNEDISNFLKNADKIAKFGVVASLASPTQPFTQTIPVMFSTATSAGSLGFGIAFNTDFNYIFFFVSMTVMNNYVLNN